MSSLRSSRALLFSVALCVAACLTAQTTRARRQEVPTPTATPAPPVVESQDDVRVSVEEVRIPVSATDEGGRFDPTLATGDLLVREDGVAQQIKGVYRLAAYVLVVADTGGELNTAKDVRLTRETAARLVSSLREGDRVAVMQVGNRAELLRGWTVDRAQAVKALREKLLSGKRSRLAEGLLASVETFRETPSGNRHLVLISDGLDSPGGRVALEEAFRVLNAANVAVHVISYTALGRKAKSPSATRMREGSSLPDEGVMSIPHTRRPGNEMPDMRDMNESKGGVTIDVERLFRRGKATRKELERREREFAELAEETGGRLWLPATAAEMTEQAASAAREISSQYVVTYRPQRPISEARAGEYRKLDVIPRRAGLRVRSRRGYVARTPSS